MVYLFHDTHDLEKQVGTVVSLKKMQNDLWARAQKNTKDSEGVLSREALLRKPPGFRFEMLCHCPQSAMDFSAIVQTDSGSCDFASIYAAGYNELVGGLQIWKFKDPDHFACCRLRIWESETTNHFKSLFLTLIIILIV
jgi:hypothetical protein